MCRRATRGGRAPLQIRKTMCLLWMADPSTSLQHLRCSTHDLPYPASIRVCGVIGAAQMQTGCIDQTWLLHSPQTRLASLLPAHLSSTAQQVDLKDQLLPLEHLPVHTPQHGGLRSRRTFQLQTETVPCQRLALGKTPTLHTGRKRRHTYSV